MVHLYSLHVLDQLPPHAHPDLTITTTRCPGRFVCFELNHPCWNYLLLAGGNQLAVGYTSVSIAFVTFIAIIVFQLEKWQQKQLQIDIKL